jgi:hypothetical protein
VAADGTVNEWSADAYSTLYVAPNTSVTLKPTCKLESVSSGDNELNYTAKDGAVSFTVGTEAVQFNSVTVGELVIEANGFPKGTDGGVYGRDYTLTVDLPAMGSRMFKLTPEAPRPEAAQASARRAAAARRKAARTQNAKADAAAYNSKK